MLSYSYPSLQEVSVNIRGRKQNPSVEVAPWAVCRITYACVCLINTRVCVCVSGTVSKSQSSLWLSVNVLKWVCLAHPHKMKTLITY